MALDVPLKGLCSEWDIWYALQEGAQMQATQPRLEKQAIWAGSTCGDAHHIEY